MKVGKNRVQLTTFKRNKTKNPQINFSTQKATTQDNSFSWFLTPSPKTSSTFYISNGILHLASSTTQDAPRPHPPRYRTRMVQRARIIKGSSKMRGSSLTGDWKPAIEKRVGLSASHWLTTTTGNIFRDATRKIGFLCGHKGSEMESRGDHGGDETRPFVDEVSRCFACLLFENLLRSVRFEGVKISGLRNSISAGGEVWEGKNHQSNLTSPTQNL